MGSKGHLIWGPVEQSVSSDESGQSSLFSRLGHNSLRSKLNFLRQRGPGKDSSADGPWNVETAMKAAEEIDEEPSSEKPCASNSSVNEVASSSVEVAPETLTMAVVEDLPSAGSVAHSVGTCQPCHYVHTKAGCEKGKRCGFCHFKHPKRPKPKRGDRVDG